RSLRDFVALDIDGEIGKVELRSRDRAGSPQLRTNAREQLGRREWFDDEIVGAEVESANFVDIAAANGEDDHRRVAGSANFLNERETVSGRHGEIGEHEIGMLRVETFPRAHAVRRGDDLESVNGEMLRERR